jgi:uncharacterized membrane protein YbhN (UPF0104 family)
VQAKKLLSTVAKIAISAIILGILGWRAWHDESFHELAGRPKNWPILLAALPVCLAAVTITILRWQMLVRTLGLDFTTRDALRAGFLGYAFNLIPLGLVAGDSVKAVMLIHKNARRKTEAVASVLVDRAIGLYGLLLLAAVASLFLPADQLEKLEPVDRATIVNLCRAVRTIAVLSTVGLVFLLIPSVTNSRLWDLLEHTPVFGPVLHKLVGAMRVYRRRVDLLLAGIGISLCVHMLYVTAVVLMTLSIGIEPQHQPQIRYIFVIVPPTMIAGAMPIGIYELSITLLFRAIAPAGAPPNMGLLIGLAYRIIQILIASIGVGYWLTSRGEVQAIMHEAEVQPPEAQVGMSEAKCTVSSA